jgi:diguanylate cyclase (GGDEF)-like protein/PAS domain S-box-containing protein
LELLPSVPKVVALASLQPEDLGLGADLDAIARRAVARARVLSGADASRGRGGGWRRSGPPGEGRDLAARRSRRAGGAPDHPWHALIGSAAQVCSDTEGDPRVDREVCRRLGTRSLITVPLVHADVSLGVITVTSSQPHAFDEAQGEVLQLLADQVTRAVVGARMITEVRGIDRHREGAFAANEMSFRRVFFEHPQPMWMLDATTHRFLAVNDAAVAKYGYSAKEFAALTMDVIRRDAAQLAVDFNRAQTGKTAFKARHRLRDGRVIDVEVATVAQEFDGRPGILVLINDVTECHRLDRQLREGAFRDPLTGGANRALLNERIRHALTRMRRRSATIAVLFINLDHFKDANDSLGHAAGDFLLQAAATRIQATLRPGDTVARMGADEFVVLLEDVGEVRDSLGAAGRLGEVFRSPLEFAGGSLTISLSIGVATSSTAETSADELLRNAGLAMYAAKAAGRGRVEVFVPSMLAAATERVSLDQDLRHAVERGELRLFLQPAISVDSGAIVGCEALVRWQHPSRGFVLPDSFIPLAEETGMITAIDTWVLHAACSQVAAWRASGLADLVLAVNISGRDLGRGELVDRVSAALLKTGFPRDHLEVEITESSAVSQTGEALNELRHLRSAGIAIAIDDFGTGYSSLSKLATFPVDRLKIDRSFLSDIKHEDDDAPLVAAMIALAHRLGLQVTAEGVETPEQLAFLRRHGCDLLQGYLFSPPVSPDRFEDLLRAQQESGARARELSQPAESGRPRPAHGSNKSDVGQTIGVNARGDPMPGTPSRFIRVLLVDDHMMFSQAVAAALNEEADIRVVDCVGSLADARSHLEATEVDVILLDQRLPDGQGTHAAAELRAIRPGARVVLVTAAVDPPVLSEALAAGCAGFVNKGDSIDELATAVRSAASGATSGSPRMLGRLTGTDGYAAGYSGEPLTHRETAVLLFLADGLSSQEISERLFISINTLRNHIQNIISKLGAHSKLEAVSTAIREGLITTQAVER